MKFAVIAALLAFACSAAIADSSHMITIPQFGLFEGEFTIQGQTGNPFDPNDNDVDVDFAGPRSHTIVPAFWDGDDWKVRFAPVATGKYSAVVSRNGSVREAQWSTASGFTCVKSKKAGFVRRDRANTQCFVFDNGQPFYPVGINQAWGPDDKGAHYADVFGKMNAAGMRWARVWMTYWDDKALEWRSSGKQPAIGDLSLDNARKLDSVIEAAQKNGVYIQLVLQHHGQYTEAVDPNWKDNPFNAANGGFLKEPRDFFTDPRAIALTKAKYRYIVARWGYSTHIMSFELFNEVQNIAETRDNFASVVSWHKQMVDYLHSIDVNHHLITTSISSPGSDIARTGLDYLQIHDYVPDVITYFATADYSSAHLPIFVGEWGASGAQTEQTTHDGVWASLETTAAAPGMFWYWDKVESEDWWHIFHSAATYLSRFGVDEQRAKKAVDVDAESRTRARLSFAMPGGWMATTSFSIDLANSGKITGLAGVSRFIQGNAHRDMTLQPIAFHLHATQPVRLSVRVGRISGNGAHPVVAVDGDNTLERDYPASGKDADGNDTLAVDIPAGEHVVTLFNTGADWFTVDRISIDNYAPSLGGIARTDGRTVDFWAYDRNRDDRAPIDGTLVLHGIGSGRYRVRLWDTWNQTEIPSEDAFAKNGDLSVPIHGLIRDWAGIATPRNR